MFILPFHCSMQAVPTFVDCPEENDEDEENIKDDECTEAENHPPLKTKGGYPSKKGTRGKKIMIYWSKIHSKLIKGT